MAARIGAVSADLVLRSDLTRRTFLGGLAVGAAVVVTTSPAQALLPRPAAPVATIVLRRREDMLRLVITPVDVNVDKGNGRVSPIGETGTLLVSFGPQAVTEKAFEPGQAPVAPTPARLSKPSQLSFIIESPVSLTLTSLLAWADREQNINAIGRYLDGEILPPGLPVGKTLNPRETQIEMPWWLVLSPHRYSSWTEQVQAKTRGGRSEIFHARLATTLPGDDQREDATYRSVRAIGMRDLLADALIRDPNREVQVGNQGHPWPMIPTPRDRADIVRLSVMTGNAAVGGKARAVKARIALSPLGGQMVAEGAWDEPGVSSLLAWQQRIWQGRDTYAKVVRRGFLYPWGFKAAEISEGVRVFRGDSRGTIRAVWELRKTIVVTEPEVDIAGNSSATPAGKRAALFQSIVSKTVMTPPLVIPDRFVRIGDQWVANDGSPMKVYTPRVSTRNGTAPFLFDLVGIDADGNQIPFTQPLLFAQQKVGEDANANRRSPRLDVPDASDPNFDPLGAQQLANFYDTSVPDIDKAAKFGGAAIAFAKNLVNSVVSDEGEVLAEDSESSATTMPTDSIVFRLANSIPGVAEGEEALELIRGEAAALAANLVPNNLPVIKEAQVLLEDSARLAQETVTAALNYPREYLENAFDEAKNKGQVFLQQAEGAVNEFVMDAARAGGVIAPNFSVAGLSRTLGNVYGDALALKAMAGDGRITPGEAFKAIQLLGGVSLADIMPNPYPGVDADGKPTGMALKIESTFLDTGLDTERALVTMSMDVNAQGEDGAEILQSTSLINVDKARLAIALETVVPTVSGSATWAVRGEFSDFIVNLVPVDGLEFVKVDVARVIFTAGSGKSSNVDVEVREVDFSGLLTLVKKLASLLPFGDVLVIDVDSRGIKAGFFFELPTLALGAFAISGLGVGASLCVPFDSRPVRFSFLMSMPDDPFTLTIIGLGGGGWMENSLGLQGIEKLNIAGFVAAEIKVDFGVASGGITARAGFQFAIGPLEPPVDGTDEGLALTAFASLNGHMDVLGIASASMDVYVGLSVIVPSPASLPDYAKLHGIASCTLRVSVAFFSKSVTFEIERTLKATYIEAPDAPSVRSRSSEEVPVATFADAWNADAWGEFCGAFG